MRFGLVAGLSVIVAAVSSAQDAPKPAPPQPSTYRLNFAIHELDQGKRLNTRSYTMMVESGSKGEVRVGAKVPVPSGGTQPGTYTQFQYVDVGANLDCKLDEKGSQVLLDTTVDFSNVESGQQPATPGGPAIRQVRTHTQAAVPPGIPTRLAALDDPVTKHSYEIEVTALKIK